MVGEPLPVQQAMKQASYMSLANFILFQVGWFACVLGAANSIPWLGPLVVFVVVAVHLTLAHQPAEEIKLLLIGLLIGGVWDSYLVASGWLIYPTGMFSAYVAPYWILAMWVLFLTTLNVSLRWMKNQLILSACLGGLAGPLAYYAGFKLDAVVMNDPLMTSLIIGIGWFFIMPVLMLITRKHDGYKLTATAGA